MTGFFVLLFFASIISLITSMAKPDLFAKILIHSRKTAGLFFGGLFILSIILIGATSPQSTTDVKGVSESLTPTPTTALAPTTITATSTLTLTPTNTPTPTVYAAPTATPMPIEYYAPTATPTQVPVQQPTTNSQGLSNDNYYTNVDGNQVHSPAYSDTIPAGATAICGDGTYSFSQHRSGTCSHHGGVAQWL